LAQRGNELFPTLAISSAAPAGDSERDRRSGKSHADRRNRRQPRGDIFAGGQFNLHGVSSTSATFSGNTAKYGADVYGIP